MRLSSMLAFVMFSLVFARDLNAQISRDKPLLPVQTNRSPLFGKDIVINDMPDRDQKNIVICSAYNGWLFAMYSYKLGDFAAIVILKSSDKGIHWEVLIDSYYPYTGTAYKVKDIMACGDSEANLTLYLAYILTHNNPDYGTGYVMRCIGSPFTPDHLVLQGNCVRDLAFANDFLYPASNTNPYSISVVISQYQFSNEEYLINTSTGNVGYHLDIHDTLISDKPFLNLSLAYGRSPSWSSGRYFAVWEQADNVNSPTGHIYTAHTEPNFDSHYTRPVCIDSLDPSAINLCRNPVIACQYNDTDNDSANLTTVILYEQYDPVNDRFDVKGVYNLQSTLTSCFKPLSFTNPEHENLQPDIAFNPYTSNFMATWYDATEQKLPFITNNLNFQQPDNWTVVSTGYNDAPDLEDPHPKVEIDFSEQKGINVWRSEGTGGNGVALFDAEYSTYTSVSEIDHGEGERLLGAYPNPCDQYLNIAFELEKSEKVTIRLYDLSGKSLEFICNQNFPAGNNTFKADVSDLSPGTYLYSFSAGEFSGYSKFSVIR